MPDDEAQLIRRCRRGDAAAWHNLFDRHFAATCRFIYQQHAEFTIEDAEEVGQEAFLSVVRNLKGFNGKSRLQTWIFRIAINKARDYAEKQRAAKRGGGVAPISLQAEDPETGLTLNVAGDDPAPDRELMERENLAAISQAVEQLGPLYREVVQLRYFGGLTYEEISKTLGLNLKTVGSRLSKALDRLAVILGTRQPTLAA